MDFFKPFPMPTGAQIPSHSVDIRDFGAVEGGKQSNTKAFASAIQAVSDLGGGRVTVPAGKWLTGPIHLKDRIELHLEEGSEVLFTQEKEEYLPAVFTLYEGVRCYTYSAQLYAHQCRDIAVTGKGTFNGMGYAWWPMTCNRQGTVDLYAAGEEHRPVEQRVYDTPEQGIRPGLLHFIACQNVLIEGVTFTYSPFWTVHPTWCENVIVRGVTVVNPPFYAPNTDGINLEGCRRGLVEDCCISAGDDAICLKSGRDEDGRVANRPCEDIVVRNCTALRSHGGITIGSETSGGVRNCLAYGCRFLDNCIGIWVKTARERGNVIENLEFRDIYLEKASHQGICITMGYYVDGNTEAELPHMPLVRNLSIENFTCKAAPVGIQIDGVRGHNIQNVYLKDLQVKADRGMTADCVSGIHMENVELL